MLVNLHSLKSALTLLPLAFSGFALGILIASWIGGDYSSTATDVPETIKRSSGSSPIIPLFFCLIVPVIYGCLIAYRVNANPNHLFLGQLRAPVFITLAAICFAGPLLGAAILFSMWT